MSKASQIISVVVSSEDNVRGIPATPFLESVEDFLKNEESADEAIKKMNEQYSSYKYLEEQLTVKKANLLSKLPEIRRSLEVVKFLLTQQESSDPMEAHYELGDHLYANAKIESKSRVCLWLGANVMVEYPVSEAADLLENNLNQATKNLNQIQEDLYFLKAQITTTEVNIARVFNYDVKQRRKAKAAATATS